MFALRRRPNPPLDFEGRGTVRRTVEGLLRLKRPVHHAAHGPPPLQRQGRIEGFTLVELMVVLVIIGLLSTIVIVSVWPALTRANTTTARAQIHILDQGIQTYRIDNGRFPTTEEGLQALVTGRYLPRIENDPWGHPYLYAVPGADGQPFTIKSLGADGREGGSEENADITN